MGILDKVKQAAEKAAEGAKKGTAQVREKMELSQLRKKADEDARQLGYLIWRERTDGTPAGEEADRLVQEITALDEQIREAQAEEPEAASGSVDVTPGEAPPMPGPEPAPPVPAPPTSSSEPAPGDFKLD